MLVWFRRFHRLCACFHMHIVPRTVEIFKPFLLFHQLVWLYPLLYDCQNSANFQQASGSFSAKSGMIKAAREDLVLACKERRICRCLTFRLILAPVTEANKAHEKALLAFLSAKYSKQCAQQGSAQLEYGDGQLCSRYQRVAT
jgi:hypothetical protein